MTNVLPILIKNNKIPRTHKWTCFAPVCVQHTQNFMACGQSLPERENLAFRCAFMSPSTLMFLSTGVCTSLRFWVGPTRVVSVARKNADSRLNRFLFSALLPRAIVESTTSFIAAVTDATSTVDAEPLIHSSEWNSIRIVSTSHSSCAISAHCSNFPSEGIPRNWWPSTHSSSSRQETCQRNTFLSWNSTCDRMSLTLPSKLSPWVTSVPGLVQTRPRQTRNWCCLCLQECSAISQRWDNLSDNSCSFAHSTSTFFCIDWQDIPWLGLQRPTWKHTWLLNCCNTDQREMFHQPKTNMLHNKHWEDDMRTLEWQLKWRTRKPPHEQPIQRPPPHTHTTTTYETRTPQFTKHAHQQHGHHEDCTEKQTMKKKHTKTLKWWHQPPHDICRTHLTTSYKDTTLTARHKHAPSNYSKLNSLNKHTHRFDVK